MNSEPQKPIALVDSPRVTVASDPRQAETMDPAPVASVPAELKAQSEYLWNTHKYKNDYIRFADTKAAFTVAFCSALLAAMYKDGLHQVFLATAPKVWSPTAWIAVGSFLSLAIAIGCGVWTIRPRLSSRQPKGLIYWGGIAEHGSPEMFWNSLRTQSQDQLTEHLAHHVFRLSELAKQKYFWVSVSMTAGAAGGGLAVLALLFR